MARYLVAVAGESFKNSDGRSRQAEIKRCSEGEPIILEREPDNRYDDQCVKVISARGVQIGAISRDAPWVAERMDAGRTVDARIHSIGSGDSGKLGVVLEVFTKAGELQAAKKPGGCAVALVIIAAGLLAMGGAEQLLAASPAKDIDAFCGGRAACVAQQRASLRYFVNLNAWYDAPAATMERCMRAGKVGRLVDWTKSEACMRRWSKGRPGPFSRAR